MIKTFEDLKDEEYLVSLGRGIAHVCWDENGGLKLKRKFDLEHTCRAIDTFNLFGKRYMLVGDRESAHIFGIDNEDALDISLPKTRDRINFIGVISPQNVVNPAISDLEQILLINHLSHGLIGMSVYDAINNLGISNAAVGNTSDKGIFKLNDSDIIKRVIVQNPEYCYKLLENELIFAGIEDGKLKIGKIKFKYGVDNAIKEIPQLPEIPYFKPVFEHKRLLEYPLDDAGKTICDNETVKCIEAYNDDMGRLNVHIGTNKTRIYSWCCERKDKKEENEEDKRKDVRIIYQGENSIICNLQALERQFRESGNKNTVLAFNTRIQSINSDKSVDTYFPIQLMGLSFNLLEQNESTTADTKSLIELMPNWFKVIGNRLYFASSKRFGIVEILIDDESRETREVMSYSNASSMKKEIQFDKYVGSIVRIM